MVTCAILGTVITWLYHQNANIEYSNFRPRVTALSTTLFANRTVPNPDHTIPYRTVQYHTRTVPYRIVLDRTRPYVTVLDPINIYYYSTFIEFASEPVPYCIGNKYCHSSQKLLDKILNKNLHFKSKANLIIVFIQFKFLSENFRKICLKSSIRVWYLYSEINSLAVLLYSYFGKCLIEIKK